MRDEYADEPDGLEDPDTDSGQDAGSDGWYTARIGVEGGGFLDGWRVSRLGRHPLQHAARDLLLGSLHRDPRAKWFHRLRRDPPAWLARAVGHLPPADRAQAAQLVALGTLREQAMARWAAADERPDGVSPRAWVDDAEAVMELLGRHLTLTTPREVLRAGGEADPKVLRLWKYYYAALDGSLDELLDRGRDDRGRLIARMRRCRPAGAVYVDAGGLARPVSFCGQARSCPWCYARRAEGLYHRLAGGPTRSPGPDDHLVLVRVRVPARGFEPSADSALLADADRLDQFTYENWYDYLFARQRFEDDHPRLADPGDLGCLDRAFVRRVRGEVGGRLVAHAQELGVRGGALALEVESYRGWRGRLGYRLSLTLLGAAAVPPGRAEEFGWDLLDGVDFEPGEPFPEWQVIPARSPQALRFAVFGSSASYPADRLGAVVSERGEVSGAYPGLWGLFALPPTFLMTAGQWRAYGEATRGLPGYTLFGTWQGPDRKSRVRASRLTLRRKRAVADRARRKRAVADRARRDALGRVNEARRAEAGRKYGELTAAARPVWEAAGRPGWKRLQRLLADAGVAVSEATARELARRLSARA